MNGAGARSIIDQSFEIGGVLVAPLLIGLLATDRLVSASPSLPLRLGIGIAVVVGVVASVRLLRSTQARLTAGAVMSEVVTPLLIAAGLALMSGCGLTVVI